MVEIVMSDDRFMSYKVTGLLYNSTKRFKVQVYSDLKDALNINLWNGSIWGVHKDGTKKLIKRVTN